MAALSVCRRNLLSSILSRNKILSSRLISTSDKKKESSQANPSVDEKFKKIPDFSKPLENKNWVSFGFSADPDEDKFMLHFGSFLIFTVLVCGTIFILKYNPDKSKEQWARREAFIRLHEREQLGLEPIDPNYVDPSKVVLPPDEELSDEDIII